MARTLNKVILIGRLGTDPDIRYMPDGTPVVNFNIATDEPVRSDQGGWESRAEWHRIVAYRRLAEICANYLSKGQLVCVEGKLRTRQWEDSQGVRRYTTEIIARDVVFMSGGIPNADETGMNQEVDSTLSEDLLPESTSKTEDDIPF